MNFQTSYEKCLVKYNEEHHKILSLVTDDKYNIVFCNGALLDMLGQPEIPEGSNLSEYASAESLPGLQTAPLRSRIMLNLGKQMPFQQMNFYVFRDANYIVFIAENQGGVLTNRILEQMGALNNDSANVSRELHKKNSLMETEIEEKIQLLEKLRESEERFRALMMQSHEAVALFDLETLQMVEANPRFQQLTGYISQETTPLVAGDLFDDELVNIMRYLDQLHSSAVLPPTLRNIKTKDGRRLRTERAGSLIYVGGRRYMLLTFRDVTEEMQRQRDLQNDLALASQVQRVLLPSIPRSDFFRIETLFRPQGFVGGDVYHLKWQKASLLLRGFLVDITGHGLATALQTAAVNVLLHEVLALPEQLTVAEQLTWLNRRISQYIDETSFAAAIAFELDFAAAELRYAVAGITDFMFNAQRISAPGLMLGIIENETYEMNTLAFSPGDSVCFMTDGIGDVLTAEQVWGEETAVDICGRFSDEDLTDKLRDDATAICITVQELARREKKQEDETRWKQV